jgi:Uma2 family endonuclease
VAVDKTKYTSQEFWDFVNLPENADRFFERIDGEIVEYPPTNLYASATAANIAYYLLKFIKENLVAGHVTGADGGYDITEDDTFALDAAYISKARQAELSSKGFNPIPPDLAVEVVSPSDLKDPKRRIQRKLEKYLAVQIPLVWYVYTERKKSRFTRAANI